LIYTCCTEAAIETMDMLSGPDGSTSRLIVGYAGYPGIALFDAKTGKELERVKHPIDAEGPFAGVVPRGSFHGNEISPDGKSFWCISLNTVYHYSLPDFKPLGHIHLAEVDQLGQPFKPSNEGTWLTISPDGKTVYAARPGRDLISVIDAASTQEVTRIPVGEYPLHISIWPRGTP
jgi:YVTN family beta-propeller protein